MVSFVNLGVNIVSIFPLFCRSQITARKLKKMPNCKKMGMPEIWETITIAFLP